MDRWDKLELHRARKVVAAGVNEKYDGRKCIDVVEFGSSPRSTDTIRRVCWPVGLVVLVGAARHRYPTR